MVANEIRQVARWLCGGAPAIQIRVKNGQVRFAKMYQLPDNIEEDSGDRAIQEEQKSKPRFALR